MGKYTRYWSVCGVLVVGLLAGCRSNKGGCCSSTCGGGCGTTTPAVTTSPGTYPYGAAGTAPGTSPVYNTAQSPAMMGQPTSMTAQPTGQSFGVR